MRQPPREVGPLRHEQREVVKPYELLAPGVIYAFALSPDPPSELRRLELVAFGLGG